jgi:hypothetical protein
MRSSITLHLTDSDMILFLGLIEGKMESLRRELFQQNLAGSPELESLKALRELLLQGDHQITSFNNFHGRDL